MGGRVMRVSIGSLMLALSLIACAHFAQVSISASDAIQRLPLVEKAEDDRPAKDNAGAKDDRPAADDRHAGIELASFDEPAAPQPANDSTSPPPSCVCPPACCDPCYCDRCCCAPCCCAQCKCPDPPAPCL